MNNGPKPVADAQKLVAPFEQKTGVKVKVELVGWDVQLDRIRNAAVSGEGPDVTQAGTTQVPFFAALGGFENLANRVAQLEQELAAAEQVLAQTERLSGQRTIPERRVSLVDGDARPIRRATRANRPSSAKAHVADTAEGFVSPRCPSAATHRTTVCSRARSSRRARPGCRCAPSTPTVVLALRQRTRRSRASACVTRSPTPAAAGANRADAIVEAPLPLPQRLRGPHLPTQAEGARADALTWPRRRADVGRRRRAQPQPPADGTAQLNRSQR
jgi:hypothetical protein